MRFFIFTFIYEFPQEKRQLKLIIIEEHAYVVLGNWKKPSIMVCNVKPFMFPNVKIVYLPMTKSNEIDGLFIIIIKVFKFTFMFLVSRMWPV